jgi:hypothetical protein
MYMSTVIIRLIALLLLFKLAFGAVSKKSPIPGLCEVNLITDDSSGRVVALNKTEKCNCIDVVFQAWIFNSQSTTYVEQINLQNCGFQGSILSLVDPANTVLKVVDIPGNRFQEPIPAFIPNLLYLKIFNIRGNRYNGSVPNFANTFSPIEIFDISHNLLSGSAANVFFKTLPSPNLQFYIADNLLSQAALDQRLPAGRPSYIDALGMKGGSPQLACVIFTQGSFVPDWCSGIGPLCVCAERCGNGYWERTEVCETTGNSGGFCCDQCTGYKDSSVKCESSPCLNAYCPGDGIDCVGNVAPSTQMCRPNVTVCDVAEYCTGTSETCPADKFSNNSIVCRAAADSCDITEFCTGTSSVCPLDLVANSSVACRLGSGLCDATEFCDGVHVTCPIDQYYDSSHPCRLANDSCDATEYCNGSSTDCPPNSFKSSSTLCRSAANNPCDVDDYCLGNTTFCPDTIASSSVVCRPAVDICDSPEKCTGINTTCPADIFLNVTNECRPATDACDIAEYCTGLLPTCPQNLIRNVSYACRPAVSPCDITEYCDGINVICPLDIIQLSNLVCRASNGTCDIAETCTGESPYCPNDTYAQDIECRASLDVCGINFNAQHPFEYLTMHIYCRALYWKLSVLSNRFILQLQRHLSSPNRCLRCCRVLLWSFSSLP